jgi:hypothetical protein
MAVSRQSTGRDVPTSATNLTPAAWENLLCGLLERANPVRSWWLQEHPQRPLIVRQLVIEGSKTLERVNDPTATSNPTCWASIEPLDRPTEVAAMMIDSVELWDEATRTWPDPPQPADPPLWAPLQEAIPDSAPDPTRLGPSGLKDRGPRQPRCVGRTARVPTQRVPPR